MKKFLLALVAVLGLATFFSGCTKTTPVVYGDYTVWLKNSSSATVNEWRVYKSAEDYYRFRDSSYNTVKPGETKGMSGIPGGNYYFVKYRIGDSWNNSQPFFLKEDVMVTIVNKQIMADDAAAPEIEVVTKAINPAFASVGVTE